MGVPDLLEDPHGMLTRLLEKVHKGHPNKTLDVGVWFGVSIAIYRCTGGKWTCIKSELFAEGECTSMFKDLQYIILPDLEVGALSDALDQVKLAGCIATSNRMDLAFLASSKEFANCIFYCSKKAEQFPVTSADRDHTQLRPTPQVTQETRTAVENPTATTAGRFSKQIQSPKKIKRSILERESANAWKPVKPIEWGKPIDKPEPVNNPDMNQNPANFSSTYEDTTIETKDNDYIMRLRGLYTWPKNIDPDSDGRPKQSVYRPDKASGMTSTAPWVPYIRWYKQYQKWQLAELTRQRDKLLEVWKNEGWEHSNTVFGGAGGDIDSRYNEYNEKWNSYVKLLDYILYRGAVYPLKTLLTDERFQTLPPVKTRGLLEMGQRGLSTFRRWQRHRAMHGDNMKRTYLGYPL